MWAGQRGRRGGQDQTFPVACTTTIKKKREMHVNMTFSLLIIANKVSELPQPELCLCIVSLVATHEYVHTVAARRMPGSQQQHNSDKENSISSGIYPCVPPFSRDKK